jgi:hypothetical protein
MQALIRCLKAVFPSPECADIVTPVSTAMPTGWWSRKNGSSNVLASMWRGMSGADNLFCIEKNVKIHQFFTSVS